jgi:hypothetical protein
MLVTRSFMTHWNFLSLRIRKQNTEAFLGRHTCKMHENSHLNKKKASPGTISPCNRGSSDNWPKHEVLTYYQETDPEL